jgi:hypothetical protein
MLEPFDQLLRTDDFHRSTERRTPLDTEWSHEPTGDVTVRGD